MHGRSFLALSLICLAFLRLPGQPLARKTLSQPTQIQGYPCAKGYAWFYADGALDRCFVSHEIPFGEATIPVASGIALTSDGKPEIVQMSRNMEIHGYLCAGGGWLGVAEGPIVAFYPSGKLKECFLAADQLVQGVPCSHGGFWITTFSGDPSLKFHVDGKLASCKLSKNYGSQRKGQRYLQAP